MATTFTSNFQEILAQIQSIDPIKYGRTRNYKDGAVTQLSPYISRGLLSTKQIAQAVLNRGYKPYEIEPFLKELAWRDYFQQVWIAKGDAINFDLKQEQMNCQNRKISKAIVDAKTGIEAIDQAIIDLQRTGYMHNHARMYTASLACSIAKSHWFVPAKWMYYYLLDADWACNALSWQWVAGSFSNKKYYANQENINTYFYTHQRNSYLDTSYETLANINTPDVLQELTSLRWETILPETNVLNMDPNLPTYIYNFYNLDCNWDKEIKANRVLLLEPSFFQQYPVCEKTIQFILDLSKNIEGIQVVVNEYYALLEQVEPENIHYKEHPTNQHYKGIQHKRDWMFETVKGYFPSFFNYWRQCEKSLKKMKHNGITIHKQNLPSKVCATCERPFTWRKKWEKNWNDVKFCSDKCRMKKS